MRAVVIDNNNLTIKECPEPTPGKGELLIRVKAAGINAADLLQLRGMYPAPLGAPSDIPGLELAGEVVETGPEVFRFAPGDRVMAIVGGGAQAELAVVHERQAMPVPETLPFEEAGGVPEAFITADDALFTQCSLSCGERLLVNGGAGGVGVAAIQLGIAVGATVTATVRNPDLRTKVANLGAKVLAPQELGNPENKNNFDVVLELIGAPNLGDDLEALRTGGRICIIGVGAGQHAQLSLLTLMNKRAGIYGSTLRSRSLEEKAAAARSLEHRVLPLFTQGRIHVPLEASYPLTEARGAYDRFAKGGKFGKIVLTLTNH
ncbi:MAG: zinc-binding dehydrogenase [Actinobacteria bacterium]|nr:zinc-binding dehydrogenase [Actinomycetota bacterium]